MASVYFDPAVGGDGSTVTDDSNPSTGLAGGGHRARFVPALVQIVAIANWVLGRTASVAEAVAETSASAWVARAAAGNANGAALQANMHADAAAASAVSAAASAATVSLPSVSGHSLEMLRVNAGASGYELRTPAQLRSDLGVDDAVFLNHFLAG